MTDEIARIAAGRHAIIALSGEWKAGPDLSEDALEGLGQLREAGLVEREFGDMGPPDTEETIDGFTVHLGACWWFRLTTKGLRVRAHIMGEGV